jgi:putative glutamine amidotransferase
MEAPLIAVNALYDAADPMLRLRLRYVDAVRRADGIPIAVAPHLGPAAQRDAEIDALLDRVDGLLLTGGDDFHAEPLGLGATHEAAVVTELAKQRFDLALTARALERDVPVLGICFGMQCMGLAGGATLIQDLATQRPGRREHRDGAVHSVQAREGTKLGRILGLGPVPVVSRHHQALRTVPPPWIVAAMDDEDLIEAIEHPELRFALGVQWHPEIALETSPPAGVAGPWPGARVHDKLLDALIDASRSSRANP